MMESVIESVVRWNELGVLRMVEKEISKDENVKSGRSLPQLQYRHCCLVLYGPEEALDLHPRGSLPLWRSF